MKWFKIGALLLLVLAAMRLVSWGIAWVLTRTTPLSCRAAAISANVAGLAAFAFLLWWNLLPGEPMDWSAILFGIGTFSAFGAMDLWKAPWTRRAPN